MRKACSANLRILSFNSSTDIFFRVQLNRQRKYIWTCCNKHHKKKCFSILIQIVDLPPLYMQWSSEYLLTIFELSLSISNVNSIQYSLNSILNGKSLFQLLLAFKYSNFRGQSVCHSEKNISNETNSMKILKNAKYSLVHTTDTFWQRIGLPDDSCDSDDATIFFFATTIDTITKSTIDRERRKRTVNFECVWSDKSKANINKPICEYIFHCIFDLWF